MVKSAPVAAAFARLSRSVRRTVDLHAHLHGVVSDARLHDQADIIDKFGSGARAEARVQA